MSDPERGFSLKRRLLVTLLATIALVWLATAGYSYFDTRHEVNKLLDAHLAQSASLLVAQARGAVGVVDLEHAPQLHKRGRRVAFQIWERGRVLRMHSVNAPEERLSARDEGFSNEVIDGKRWRVFSGWDAERRYLIQVGERDEARREIAGTVAASLLTPLLVALPALGIFAWLSIRRALRPLKQIGEELIARRPDNLAPLAVDGVPVEVAPLVKSLDALFGRMTHLIENERRFTADAAHELRTPLAALRTQAQVALGATGDEERRRALGKVVAGCDRATRLVEQLLTLARLDPEQISESRNTCDLRALAGKVIADLAPTALAKEIDIELAKGAAVAIEGCPELITILMRNLIDNAVRYSPRGANVCVRIVPEADTALLAVIDRGPGIPEAERAKVGQRFYRIAGTGETGSGLGLSIVNRIAEMHDATVRLDGGPDGGGLRASVAFPRPASA
jgi:two-component system sensor histidine kinase QseC